MKYDQKLFTDEDIRIDENVYTSCIFRNCRIIFTGKGPAQFSNCKFDQCQWVFDDAAEQTIQYLAALYTGLGPGGEDLVEGIFDSIRQGGVGHGAIVPGTPKELLRR
jgi:hypothetical protein